MVDYRKWDHIEVSDDEDDTHPNIDTPSLFRAFISSFFTKILVADEEYKAAFYSELEAFEQRIVKRAKEKIEKAMEEERLDD